MPKKKIAATAAGVAGALALAGFAAPTAAADPPGIPFVPGVPAPLPATPGSYTYIYNNFPAVAPATVDARSAWSATAEHRSDRGRRSDGDAGCAHTSCAGIAGRPTSQGRRGTGRRLELDRARGIRPRSLVHPRGG
ncbi:Uncharacterised protein [Mycobacteroides abscessus subsp. abscessus]|nr:Uncharacterised protein [Mycobacteroides abscessus subsp. abscessus]